MEHRRTEDLVQIKGLILAGSAAEGRRKRSRGTGSDMIITTVESPLLSECLLWARETCINRGEETETQRRKASYPKPPSDEAGEL